MLGSYKTVKNSLGEIEKSACNLQKIGYNARPSVRRQTAVQNPKHEYRNPKQIRISNFKMIETGKQKVARSWAASD